MSSPDSDPDVRTVSVSQKGQATIPKEIREAVGIEPGGDVLVYEESGRVVIEPFPSTPEELHGIHAGDREAPSILEKSREWDDDDREREAAQLRRLCEQLADEPGVDEEADEESNEEADAGDTA